MDALAALRWQIEFGADEALEDMPCDRLARAAERERTEPSPAGGTPADHAPVDRAPVDRAPVDRAPVDRAPVDRAPVDRAPVASRRAGPASPPPAPAARDAAVLAATAATLPALRAAIAAFEGCALRATATHLVFAEGDPEAGLLLIGDAPSSEDDRAGTPFAGTEGAYLDRMLASIGLNRSRLLLARLVPWRPPGDRPPSTTERAACLPFLHRLIALARPRRIFLLGALAAQDLLVGAAGRRPKRGVWYDLPLAEGGTIPTLAGPDPAKLGRTPGDARRQAWADLRMLRRGIDGDITKS